MSTGVKAERRTLQYRSLAELLVDAERIAAQSHVAVGNWSCGQILHHLAMTINASFDGFGFQAPWFARKLIAPLARRSFLTKTMKAGFRLPAAAVKLHPPSTATPEEGLDRLRAAVARHAAGETPSAPHPFLGEMTPRDWEQVHLRHAELHMSFLVPSTR